MPLKVFFAHAVSVWDDTPTASAACRWVLPDAMRAAASCCLGVRSAMFKTLQETSTRGDFCPRWCCLQSIAGRPLIDGQMQHQGRYCPRADLPLYGCGCSKRKLPSARRCSEAPTRCPFRWGHPVPWTGTAEGATACIEALGFFPMALLM